MTSLKRHFLINSSTDFSEVLVADVTLMLRRLLTVLHRYLPPLLSYRENLAGRGGIRPPPPSGASVNGLLELWVESHWSLINTLEPQMYKVISLSEKAQVARRADGGEKGCLQVDWNWNKVCDWSFIKPPTKPRSQAQNSGRSKPKPKTAVKKYYKAEAETETIKNRI